METYERLVELLEKELKQFANKSEISSSHLEMIDMITHSIKSIETIMAMRGSSGDYSGTYSGTRRRNRADNMGGTSHESRRYYRDDNYYSGAGSEEDILRELEEMKRNAPEGMKRKFQSMIDEMRR